MRCSLSALSLLLLLSACTTTVPKDFSFNSAGKSGLIAFGMTAPIAATSLRIGRINPATCRAASFAGFSDKSYAYVDMFTTPGRRSFHLDDFEPGWYVIKSVSTSIANFTNVLSLQTSSLAFRVEPGRLSYIGDVVVQDRSRSIGFAGYDEAALREYVGRFPGITVTPSRAEAVQTPFSFEDGTARIPGCMLPPSN